MDNIEQMQTNNQSISKRVENQTTYNCQHESKKLLFIISTKINQKMINTHLLDKRTKNVDVPHIVDRNFKWQQN